MFSGVFLLLGTVLIGLIVALSRSSSTVAVAHAVPSQFGNVRIAPLGVPLGGATRNIVVDQHNQDLDRVLAAAWVVLVIAALGSAVLGWFLAGRVLRPLREMASTARTITAGSLHARLALAGPNDEFRQLGDTFDDLLGRLEAAFDGQRRFVANASHELRTPLTVERTLLQVALANPQATEQSLRAACEELLASQVDHERLLEALLTLASSERGLEPENIEPIDLAAVARSTLDATGVVAGVQRRGLRVDASLQPATIVGDSVLVKRLVANLVDNGVDHNVDAGWLSVGTGLDGAQAVLSVRNGGRPIASSEVARLFEPFQRLDGRGGSVNGNGTHHGLGLSIVRAIALIHGGEASAEALIGGGLAVTVRFPLGAPDPGANGGQPQSSTVTPSAAT
jgi:signal transduction histidine kinase